MVTVQRPTATAAVKREAKRQSTKAIKRRKTLMKKAHEFYKDCGFEVLLLLQKGSGRSYIYTSSGIRSWHPIVEDLVSLPRMRPGKKLIQESEADIPTPHSLHSGNSWEGIKSEGAGFIKLQGQSGDRISAVNILLVQVTLPTKVNII